MIQHVGSMLRQEEAESAARHWLRAGVELNQAAAGWFGAGDVLHPCEQLGKRITVRTLGGPEDYFVGVVETEGDRVAILKLAAIDFFSVDEEAAALAAIFDIEAIGFDDHGRAVAGDAAVGELQMVAGLNNRGRS